MNLHPAYDVFYKHHIRFVANAPDGTFTTNCPECGGRNNFAHYDDDVAEWHCHDCGKGKIVRLRAGAKVDRGQSTLNDDDEARRAERAFEEREFDDEDDDKDKAEAEGGAEDQQPVRPKMRPATALVRDKPRGRQGAASNRKRRGQPGSPARGSSIRGSASSYLRFR